MPYGDGGDAQMGYDKGENMARDNEFRPLLDPANGRPQACDVLGRATVFFALQGYWTLVLVLDLSDAIGKPQAPAHREAFVDRGTDPQWRMVRDEAHHQTSDPVLR